MFDTCTNYRLFDLCGLWFVVVLVLVVVANGMGTLGRDGANDRWGISVRVSG